MAYQMIDPEGGVVKTKFITQSHRGPGRMYLCITTSVHRLFVELSLHPNFASRAFKICSLKDHYHIIRGGVFIRMMTYDKLFSLQNQSNIVFFMMIIYIIYKL